MSLLEFKNSVWLLYWKQSKVSEERQASIQERIQAQVLTTKTIFLPKYKLQETELDNFQIKMTRWVRGTISYIDYSEERFIFRSQPSYRRKVQSKAIFSMLKPKRAD